jgi:hypothetical protein
MEYLDNTDKKPAIESKIKIWLKNPYNLAFLCIFILIVAIRLYYFFMTLNQPLWWDESEYLSAAKNFAGIVPYELSGQRLPGFPLLVSLFYKFGISNEQFLRFILCLVPSIISIYLLYRCVREMYSDKKIALISLAIFGVLWEHLFYSNRFQTENLSLIFEFLAILILFKCYIKKENFSFIKSKYSLIYIALFSIISVFIRPGNLIFLPALFIFVILLNIKKFLTKRGILLLIATILIFPAGIFIASKISAFSGLFSYYHPENALAWYVFRVFGGFYESILSWLPSLLYYSFILGLLFLLFEFFIKIHLFKKIDNNSENLDFKSDIFNFILVVSVLALFFFIIRPYPSFEYRWFFPFITAMLAFTAKGMIVFSNYIGRLLKNKNIALIILIVILALGTYSQLMRADGIIKTKINSYIEIKEASLFVKENTSPGDVVFSRSLPQTTYYSERKTYSHSELNESQFIELVNKTRPKYMIEYAAEPHPAAWGLNPPPIIQKILIPVKVWFADTQQTQIMEVVYEFNKTIYSI